MIIVSIIHDLVFQYRYKKTTSRRLEIGLERFPGCHP